MKYIVVGSDIEKAESWMLHGIYSNRNDAENGAIRNARSEINPQRYHYSVVEIAQKEMELFRTMPADPAIQAVGNVADVELQVSDYGAENHTTVRFTNVPMEHVHAAIGVLNGDKVGEVWDVNSLYPTPVAGFDKLKMNAEYVRSQRDVTISRAPRTEDFTTGELFPALADGFSDDNCHECGAHVQGRFQERHTTWHNKLLP